MSATARKVPGSDFGCAASSSVGFGRNRFFILGSYQTGASSGVYHLTALVGQIDVHGRPAALANVDLPTTLPWEQDVIHQSFPLHNVTLDYSGASFGRVVNVNATQFVVPYLTFQNTYAGLTQTSSHTQAGVYVLKLVGTDIQASRVILHSADAASTGQLFLPRAAHLDTRSVICATHQLPAHPAPDDIGTTVLDRVRATGPRSIAHSSTPGRFDPLDIGGKVLGVCADSGGTDASDFTFAVIDSAMHLSGPHHTGLAGTGNYQITRERDHAVLFAFGDSPKGMTLKRDGTHGPAGAASINQDHNLQYLEFGFPITTIRGYYVIPNGGL